MTTFDDRNKTFENKFAHDNEMDFKIQARTTKMLALWAANLMGLPEIEAEKYATTMLEAELEKYSTDDVVKHLLTDFQAKSIAMTERDIRDEMERKEAAARKHFTIGS